MKKLLTILMIGFLVSTMSLMPLKAAASFDSLVSYGEGDNIYGNCQGKNVVLNENLKGIMVSNSSQLFFIGNDDFKIDVGNPVKNFEVIGDVDNDGYKDVAVYLDVDDGYDDFKIISSKTSKELYASKYLYKEINDNGETIDKNAVIRQIVYDDNIVYLIRSF